MKTVGTTDFVKALAKGYRLIQAAENSAKTSAGKNHVNDVRLYTDYADQVADRPIAVANWNNLSKWNPDKRVWTTTDNIMVRLGDALERAGFDLQWQDEHCGCNNCNKLVRTEPDSFFWKPSYKVVDGDIFCSTCLKDQ